MPDDEPFKRYTPDELTQIFLAGGAQAEDLRAAQLEWKAPPRLASSSLPDRLPVSARCNRSFHVQRRVLAGADGGGG